jgi:hypothetical protein
MARSRIGSLNAQARKLERQIEKKKAKEAKIREVQKKKSHVESLRKKLNKMK